MGSPLDREGREAGRGGLGPTRQLSHESGVGPSTGMHTQPQGPPPLNPVGVYQYLLVLTKHTAKRRFGP